MVNNSNGKSKTVTSKDVAALAGVSQSTVSRAFSDESKLTFETRRRVLEAAEELGYRPNAIARGLISSKTGFIGVVKGPTYNPMFGDLLTSVTEQIQKTNHQIIYYEAGPNKTIDDILPRILQYRVEGIILLYANLSSQLTQTCQDMGIPVLQMLRYSTNVQANVVLPDNHQGAMLAADHLLQKGYKRFAYVTGELNSSSNMERQLGFITRLAENGVDKPTVILGDYTYESGFEAGKKLMRDVDGPLGILCANDLMGLGVIDAAKELKVRIPEDVGVIGFDNNFMSHWPVYQLTSLAQPIDDMARRGIEVLQENIQDPGRRTSVERYEFQLVERGSTDRKG